MLDALAIPPRLTRAEYDELVERGEFIDQRVELIRGRIVEMSPQGPLHSAVIRRLNKLLIIAVGDHAEVQPQSPLAISDDSEPEPDFAIIEAGDYDNAHPRTALLLIEVSNSSLMKDRGEKGPLYAAAGIPEYWIIDVVAKTVEVYLHPEAGEYQSVVTRTHGDVLRPTRLPMVEVAVAAIF